MTVDKAQHYLPRAAAPKTVTLGPVADAPVYRSKIVYKFSFHLQISHQQSVIERDAQKS